MKNIIIPVINEEMLKFVDEVKSVKDVKVIIGVRQDLFDKVKNIRKKNFTIKVYENTAKKEEIINSLKDQIDEGKLLICRKAITAKEIEMFFNSEADITICAEKRNKFQNFFFKLWQFVMEFLFGFKFYDGDISVIAFNDNLFKVVSYIDNLSYSSRVNKWKGVQIKTIETESPKAKKEYNKIKANFMLYGWITLYLATIASAFVFFWFVRATFLTGLLFASAILIVQIALIIAIAIYNLNLRVGQRLFNKAKAVK